MNSMVATEPAEKPATPSLLETWGKNERMRHIPSAEWLSWGLSQAVSALHTLDPNLFGRRYPFQTFERSKGEVIYGALLVILDHVNRVMPLVRAVDPDLDSRLHEDLVRLHEPLREQAMA